MKFSWRATRARRSPNGGNITARNQKVPSARESCVSSLAVSRYLTTSLIKNVAGAQRLARNDSQGQKTVGGERLQSLAAERFDVSRSVRRLQQPCPFLRRETFFGPCEKRLLRKIYASFLEQWRKISWYSCVWCGWCYRPPIQELAPTKGFWLDKIKHISSICLDHRATEDLMRNERETLFPQQRCFSNN